MTVGLQTTRRPTSADVAREAGVSRSTVSQILNGDDERFPLATRERVRSAAEALNYRPSRAGRALVTGLSDIVVVVVPNATFGPHLQDSVDRITNATAASGMSVVVRFGRPDDESTLISVLDLRPAAVVDMGVFTNAQRERIEAAGTRVVPRRRLDTPTGDVDPVDILIGRLQVDELLRGGERQIVYASLDDGRLDPFGPPRLEGIRRSTAAHGLVEPITIRVPLSESGAVEALLPLLQLSDGPPLGICCYNDDVAIAVIAAARRLRLDVPNRISLIGVDRTDIGQLISPRLTTVAVDQPALMDSLSRELVRNHSRGDEDAPGDAVLDASRLVRVVAGETS